MPRTEPAPCRWHVTVTLRLEPDGRGRPQTFTAVPTLRPDGPGVLTPGLPAWYVRAGTVLGEWIGTTQTVALDEALRLAIWRAHAWRFHCGHGPAPPWDVAEVWPHVCLGPPPESS